MRKGKIRLSLISFAPPSSMYPPTTGDRLTFGRIRRMLPNRVTTYRAYQTPTSSIIAGEKRKLHIWPSRGLHDMQDIGSTTVSMWKFFNKRRLKPNSEEINFIYLNW